MRRLGPLAVALSLATGAILVSQDVRGQQPPALAGGAATGAPAPDACPPANVDAISVSATGGTYRAVTDAPTGTAFFATGQNADILLSGIDFDNTGGSLLFNHPAGIASDGTKLAMTDTFNNRVLIWNTPPASNVPPNVVLGQANFTTNNPGTGRNQMNFPVSVSIGGGKLFVSDTNNDRLLIWNSIPTTSGTAADVIINSAAMIAEPIQERWPWGIWSDGTKMVATATIRSKILVWNTVPTTDNVAPDLTLDARASAGGTGLTGTPRHVSSNGTMLFIGDHNARVPGKSEHGTFVWTTFPTTNTSPFSFFREDVIEPSNGTWLKGIFIGSAFWALGRSMYSWATPPASAADGPALTLSHYDYMTGGDYGGLAYAGGKLYLAAGNANRIAGFNALPTTTAAVPDFTIGSTNYCTNSLTTNYFIQNGVPRSNGSNLFVSSDFDRKLYVWRNIPDQSNPPPDLVYRLPFQPWAMTLRGSTLVLGGERTIYIWDTLPLNGEMPVRQLRDTIGGQALQSIKGVALDDTFFYVADTMADKVYVWNGLPQSNSAPAFSLSVNDPWRITSDGTYLAVTQIFDQQVLIYQIAGLNATSVPLKTLGGFGGSISFNLPQDAYVGNGRLFVADSGFNRVVGWSSLASAIGGGAADIVVGATSLTERTPEIGRDKSFSPAAVWYDGRFLWVGEIKFSTRMMRYSPPCSYHQLSATSQSFGVSGGSGTLTLTPNDASCSWTVASNASFVSVTSGSSGAGTGSVSFTVAANTSGAARSGTVTVGGRTFTITQDAPTVAASPASLRFSATKAGAAGALTAQTAAQDVTVSFTGGSPSWSATTSTSWLQVTSGAGSGSGRFRVAVINPSNTIGSSTSLSGTVLVTASGVGNSPLSVPVTLTVDQTGTSTEAAFGQVDTPVQGATGLVGAIGVTGWLVDDVGITGVKIYRNCLTFENQASCQLIAGHNVVFIGDAAFVPGARPDVEAAYSTYPASNVAGWGYLLLTNMLPNVSSQLGFGGQGNLDLYVFATDVEGHVTLLGRTGTDHTPTSITMSNNSIAKPFGAIDTPSQGGTVSGTFANFGWVLTPDANTAADGTDILMPTNGSSMRVFIDGVSIGNVTYNQCRGNVGNPVPAGVYCNDDVANIFGNATPQPVFTARAANATLFRNLDAGRAAIGSFDINTSGMTNGMHSIAWGVSDTANRSEGIGSRNFFVLNTGGDGALPPPDGGRDAFDGGRVFRPGDHTLHVGSKDPTSFGMDVRVTGRSGFSLETPFTDVVADGAGERHVQIDQMGRVELRLGADIARGYLVANGTLRDLPVGSHLDVAAGTFTWAPAPGYLGAYRLVFVTQGQKELVANFRTADEPEIGYEHFLAVTVTIRASRETRAGESEIRMHVDTPVAEQTVGRTFTIAGWSLDPQAFTGSGIGAVHVWARRLDAPTLGPQFLGAATLRVARPDVAAVFGPSFGAAGYTIERTLAPGLYELTVYVWNQRTARWEDARAVRVRVR